MCVYVLMCVCVCVCECVVCEGIKGSEAEKKQGREGEESCVWKGYMHVCVVDTKLSNYPSHIPSQSSVACSKVGGACG